MQKGTIAAVAATTIWRAGLLSGERAQALPAGGPETVHAGAQVDPVDTAHYRRCWRGYHRGHCRYRHYHRYHRW